MVGADIKSQLKRRQIESINFEDMEDTDLIKNLKKTKLNEQKSILQSQNSLKDTNSNNNNNQQQQQSSSQRFSRHRDSNNLQKTNDDKITDDSNKLESSNKIEDEDDLIQNQDDVNRDDQKFSESQKIEILKEALIKQNIKQTAQKYDITSTVIRGWRIQYGNSTVELHHNNIFFEENSKFIPKKHKKSPEQLIQQSIEYYTRNNNQKQLEFLKNLQNQAKQKNYTENIMQEQNKKHGYISKNSNIDIIDDDSIMEIEQTSSYKSKIQGNLEIKKQNSESNNDQNNEKRITRQQQKATTPIKNSEQQEKSDKNTSQIQEDKRIQQQKEDKMIQEQVLKEKEEKIIQKKNQQKLQEQKNQEKLKKLNEKKMLEKNQQQQQQQSTQEQKNNSNNNISNQEKLAKSQEILKPKSNIQEKPQNQQQKQIVSKNEKKVEIEQQQQVVKNSNVNAQKSNEQMKVININQQDRENQKQQQQSQIKTPDQQIQKKQQQELQQQQQQKISQEQKQVQDQNNSLEKKNQDINNNNIVQDCQISELEKEGCKNLNIIKLQSDSKYSQLQFQQPQQQQQSLQQQQNTQIVVGSDKQYICVFTQQNQSYKIVEKIERSSKILNMKQYYPKNSTKSMLIISFLDGHMELWDTQEMKILFQKQILDKSQENDFKLYNFIIDNEKQQLIVQTHLSVFTIYSLQDYQEWKTYQSIDSLELQKQEYKIQPQPAIKDMKRFSINEKNYFAFIIQKSLIVINEEKSKEWDIKNFNQTLSFIKYSDIYKSLFILEINGDLTQIQMVDNKIKTIRFQKQSDVRGEPVGLESYYQKNAQNVEQEFLIISYRSYCYTYKYCPENGFKIAKRLNLGTIKQKFGEISYKGIIPNKKNVEIGSKLEQLYSVKKDTIYKMETVV